MSSGFRPARMSKSATCEYSLAYTPTYTHTHNSAPDTKFTLNPNEIQSNNCNNNDNSQYIGSGNVQWMNHASVLSTAQSQIAPARALLAGIGELSIGGRNAGLR